MCWHRVIAMSALNLDMSLDPAVYSGVTRTPSYCMVAPRLTGMALHKGLHNDQDLMLGHGLVCNIVIAHVSNGQTAQMHLNV